MNGFKQKKDGNLYTYIYMVLIYFFKKIERQRIILYRSVYRRVKFKLC